MECPSCGKLIPDESAFCLFCGERIPDAGRPVDPSAGWEYQEIFLPIADFAVKEKLILRNREEPVPADLEKLWSVYLPQVSGLLKPALVDQWALDPGCLEPECMLYEVRGQTFQDYTRADWFWTAALSILSVGIYLLFVQLVNRSNQVIEPKGVNLRLRRKKE